MSNINKAIDEIVALFNSVVFERDQCKLELETLRTERYHLKTALRYVAYVRINNLGQTLIETLSEPRQRYIYDLLEPSQKIEQQASSDEQERAEETCEHDWNCQGADRSGNWVSVCRKCGQIRE